MDIDPNALAAGLRGTYDGLSPDGQAAAHQLASEIDLSDLPNSHGGSFVSGLVHALRSGATLPGDVATGKIDPMSDEGIARAQDMAGLAMTGGMAGTGTEVGQDLAAGYLRPAIKYNGKVYKAPEGSKSHIDALDAIADPQVRDRATWDASTRGFVDEGGKYYDRRRAQAYAVKEDLIDPNAPSWAKTSPELIAENLKLPPPKQPPAAVNYGEIDDLLRQLGVDDGTTLGSGSTDKRGAAMVASSLPMDEASRMGRAKELGYEPARPLYHGTKGDFDQFDLGRAGQSDHGASGRGVYMTEDPATASLYAQLTPGEGNPNVMPLLARTKNPYNATADAILPRSGEESAAFTRMVKDRGHDSIAIHGNDGKLNELVVLDPSNIRSRFAAFDPANEGKNMLLGSGGTDAASAAAPAAATANGSDIDYAHIDELMRQLHSPQP